MSDFLIRASVFGLMASGLAACATTPTYPTTTPAPAAHAAAPAPKVAQASPPPSPPPVSGTTAPGVTAQLAPQGVESQPLAPISPPTSAGAAPSVAPPSAPRTMTPPVARAELPRPPPVRYIATGKVIDAKRMYRDYEVRKGDHLDAVARDLQTTSAVLLEANHVKNPNVLIPGQHLKVPIEKAYVTEPGDTLAAVAKRFDVSELELADLNVMSEHQKLRPGEQLALPAVYHDRGPVAAPQTYAYAQAPSYRASSYGASSYGASSYGTPASGRYTPSPWAQAAGASHSGTYAYQPSVRAPLPYPSTTAPTAPERTDAELSAAGQGRFVWPVRGEILSAFGVQDVGRRNDGVDIKSPQGSTVHAAAAGEVVYAGDQVPGFGNLVLVKHADGWVTAYAHLDRVSVKMRETVVQGQEIGQVGQTGGVSEPQLHFEVRYAATPIQKAKPINPLLVLPQ